MYIYTSPAGVKYKINDRSEPIYEVIQVQDYFESKLTHISIEHLTNRPGVIVDAGANIGTYCLELAIKFPDCKIYAFDPVVPTYAELEENIRLNGFTNIESYRIGLGNKECELESEDPDTAGSYDQRHSRTGCSGRASAKLIKSRHCWHGTECRKESAQRRSICQRIAHTR